MQSFRRVGERLLRGTTSGPALPANPDPRALQIRLQKCRLQSVGRHQDRVMIDPKHVELLLSIQSH